MIHPVRTLSLTVAMLACFTTLPAHAAEVGEHVPRVGDEIVICGQMFHTTAPVVLWIDPGGYDAYRVERRFSELDKSSWAESEKEVEQLKTPNRYGLRQDNLSDQQLAKVRGGGWDLPLLKEVVDQLVIHYDVCGISQQCFKVLHDYRGLSVHFMIDIDGTIYQTLDLKERAWHATISNSRSVGVEMTGIGAYPPDKNDVLKEWYFPDEQGGTMLRPPRKLGHLGLRTKPFYGRPDRPAMVVGEIQGKELTQYDFTAEQYASLIKLTATLCRVFPKLECRYPHDAECRLIPHKLSDEQWKAYHGVLGHYHVQGNKVDPGPAFNWNKVIGGANKLLETAPTTAVSAAVR